MKFATKLSLLFLGLFVVISLVVLYSVTSSTKSIMTEEIGDKLEEQAFNAMDKIDRTLYQRQLTVTNISKGALARLFAATDNPTTDSIQKILEGIQTRNDYFESLSFFTMDRIRIADTNRLDLGKKHTQNEYWPEIELGRESIFGMYFSESVNKAVFHFASIVKGRNGKPVGVVVARIPVEHLNDIAVQAGGIHDDDKKMVASGLMKVVMVDKNGLIVYSNYNPDSILKETFADWKYVSKEVWSGNWIDSEKFVRPDGKEEILAWAQEQGYKKFKGNGWTLLMTLPAKIALAPAEHLQNRITAILFVSGLISIIGIILFSRTISKPIEALALATREIADGNFHFELPVKSNDEFGRLAESFNFMSRALFRTNESLRENEKQLKNVVQEREAILETAEVGIAYLVNRKPVWANPHAEKIYGYTREEMVAMPDASAIYTSREAFEEFGRQAIPVLEAGESFQIEQKMRRKDGVVIWCRIVGKAVAPLDFTQGVIWVMEDITERKRLEEDLRLAKERAEAATSLKDKFVSLVSHDLKSPLGIMIGLVKMLRNDPVLSLKDSPHVVIDKIIDSGTQMVGLIDDVLAAARLRSGHLKLNKQFFDASYLGIKMASDYSSLAGAKGIALENKIPANSRIYADKTLLTEAVQNLVSNAVKFCRPGDAITIYMEEGEAAIICVRDTGPGIKPELAEKVFKYEEKTSTTGTAGEMGTGMGLPFVKDIMEYHEGSLELRTEPGKGCLFRLKLPFVRPKILLVDDDEGYKLLLKAMLAKQNADVIEAKNGEEALKAMAGVRPHLIITEVNMPVMGGLELLQTVKTNEDTKEIPVIVVTSECGTEMKDKISKLGADYCATKVDMDEYEFIPKVRRFVG